MKNITVAVPEDVYRRARIHAAEQGRSVSALVADFLGGLAGGDAEFTRLEEQQRRILSEIRSFRAGERMTRDEVHDRAVH